MFSYLICKKGVTGVEYVLLAAGIAILIMVAVFAFGGDMSGMLDNLSDVTDGPAE